jgi:hypothetical protein
MQGSLPAWGHRPRGALSRRGGGAGAAGPCPVRGVAVVGCCCRSPWWRDRRHDVRIIQRGFSKFYRDRHYGPDTDGCEQLRKPGIVQHHARDPHLRLHPRRPSRISDGLGAPAALMLAMLRFSLSAPAVAEQRCSRPWCCSTACPIDCSTQWRNRSSSKKSQPVVVSSVLADWGIGASGNLARCILATFSRGHGNAAGGRGAGEPRQ